MRAAIKSIEGDKLRREVEEKREGMEKSWRAALAAFYDASVRQAEGVTSRRLARSALALKRLKERCEKAAVESAARGAAALAPPERELEELAGVALDAVEHARKAFYAVEALHEAAARNAELPPKHQKQLQRNAHRTLMLLTALAKLRLVVANAAVQVVHVEVRGARNANRHACRRDSRPVNHHAGRRRASWRSAPATWRAAGWRAWARACARCWGA